MGINARLRLNHATKGGNANRSFSGDETMKDQTEYACNLAGVAQFALDRWKDAKDRFPSGQEDDDNLYTGLCQAYSAVLRQITGVSACISAPERWQASINAMTT